MPTKPTRLIRVQNLSESLPFYVEKLGLTVVGQHPDAAHLQTAMGEVLLAGPGASDVAAYLAPSYGEAKPGSVIYFFAPDIVAMAERLPEATYTRTAWGERKLELPDPNGYTISFWTENDLTEAQMLDLFRSAPDKLDAALAGLSEAQLDLARAPGKWSIRQIAHHITDSAVGAIGRLRYAAAEPGRLFHPNPYDPDLWAVALVSHRRPVEPSVALFRAMHAHMLQLIEYVPDCLERYTVDAAGAKAPVGRMVGMLAVHAAGHIDQIWQTRQAHGL